MFELLIFQERGSAWNCAQGKKGVYRLKRSDFPCDTHFLLGDCNDERLGVHLRKGVIYEFLDLKCDTAQLIGKREVLRPVK